VFKRSLWVKHDVFWAQLDVFNRIFDAVSDDPDIEYAVIDGTIFKVHCRGQGAKGKSEGRMTTKSSRHDEKIAKLKRRARR
jgi:hypothetical protein